MARTRLLALLVILVSAATPVWPETANTAKPEFAPGQVWSIKAASPTTTKVVIGRVEPWNGRVAISISLIDVPMPAGALGPGGLTTIHHMPFEQSALSASVDRLLATG